MALVDDEAIDFALAAWLEDGQWQVEPLPPRHAASFQALIDALRAHPGESGCLGMVSVAEDFFLLVLVHGDRIGVLLSDVTAAHDWPIAAEVAEHLGAAVPGADQLDDVRPVGDFSIVAEIGMSADELDFLCSDIDLYPDEVLASVATRLGFAERFDAAVRDVNA